MFARRDHAEPAEHDFRNGIWFTTPCRRCGRGVYLCFLAPGPNDEGEVVCIGCFGTHEAATRYVRLEFPST